MTDTAKVTIRCTTGERARAAAVAEAYGRDLSAVTRALWLQMARTGDIPLELKGAPRPDSAGTDPGGEGE